VTVEGLYDSCEMDAVDVSQSCPSLGEMEEKGDRSYGAGLSAARALT
jgi:hypothetical protein